MGVHKNIWYMYAFTSLALEVNMVETFPFTGNLSWYALVPVKFQVGEINISLEICFLRCFIITTFGTPIWFQS